jgi:hypothetical protein
MKLPVATRPPTFFAELASGQPVGTGRAQIRWSIAPITIKRMMPVPPGSCVRATLLTVNRALPRNPAMQKIQRWVVALILVLGARLDVSPASITRWRRVRRQPESLSPVASPSAHWTIHALLAVW